MDCSKLSIVFALLVAGGLSVCQSAMAADQGGSPAVEAAPGPLPGESCLKLDDAKAPPTAGCQCQSPACGEVCVERNWFVETEAVWLAPIQGQSFGGVAFLNGDATTEFATQNNGSFTLTPRITWGVQGKCWGLLGRYWRLQTGDLSATLPTINGSGSAVENNLRAETADFEVTRLFTGGEKDGELRLSVGVRYAQLSEAAGLMVDQIDDLSYYRGTVFAKQSFSGTGVTAGLRGIRPVGCGCFNLFFDARASVMWDSTQVNYVTTRAEYLGIDPDAYSVHEAISASPNHLFIGEVKVGGQWNLPLQCVPANAFLRLALEYQYWGTGISGGAEAFSAAGLLDGPVIVAAGTSGGATHVNMLGFSVGTGLSW